MPAGSTPHTMRIAPPVVHGQQVRFRWTVEPRTALYHRCDFSLRFGDELDPSAVPPAVWWRVALLCLHSHWALLAPCRVELPVALPDGEDRFWERLAENARRHVEAYGARSRPRPVVEIVARGPSLAPVELPVDPRRAALAFSGGKDSLALGALVSELSEPPLLVTITSPVPWARDHKGGARVRAREQASRLFGAPATEVRSDYRTSWELGFTAEDGCRLGVHELSDLPLYEAVLFAVGAMTGRGRLYLASEAEIQYNGRQDGTVLLHREFLSSAATQSALNALFERFGLRITSLLHPFHMPQVETLILHRYPQLLPLQLSCWRPPGDERACSTCTKCLSVSLALIGQGVHPMRAGIDPVVVLPAAAFDVSAPPAPPQLHLSRNARHNIVRHLRSKSLADVRVLLESEPKTAADPRLPEALAVYAQMRAQALTMRIPPAPGYLDAFVDWAPPDLQAGLRTLADEHFPAAREPDLTEMADRAREVAEWITAPLA